jgi:hypothetical protein
LPRLHRKTSWKWLIPISDIGQAFILRPALYYYKIGRESEYGVKSMTEEIESEMNIKEQLKFFMDRLLIVEKKDGLRFTGKFIGMINNDMLIFENKKGNRILTSLNVIGEIREVANQW